MADKKEPEMVVKVKQAPMMTLRNAVFNNEPVRLDGHFFKDCTFNKCALVFSGYSLPGFDGCDFNNCDFFLDGFATNTLAFLSMLNALSPELVENYFKDIRSGHVLRALGISTDDHQ